MTGDVDLATFAAVQAGLADAFPEEEVLAHHQLAQGPWARARLRWTTRLVEEGQDGPLFLDYRAALQRREDELGREVAPLDRDLDAWLGFVVAMATEEPASLLSRTGLRLPDLSRLSRAWARRLDGDPDLKRQAEEKRAAGPAPRIPELRLGVSRLAAAGGGPGDGRPERAATSTDLAAFEEVMVADYVAILARLERPENLLRSVLRARNVDERTWTRERARIETAMADDPVFRREVAVLLSFERSRLDVARSSERTPSVPPPPPTASAASLASMGPFPGSFPVAALVPAPVPDPIPGPASVRVPVAAPDPTSAPGPASAAGAGLLDEGGIVDEGTSIVDEGTSIVDEGTSIDDEATAFELPFARGGAALPFAAEPAPPPSARGEIGRLPIAIDDHARMHVELNAGYDESLVLARYHLDPARRVALDAQVDDLKRRDPTCAAAWLDAYQAHTAWLLAEDDADA